jgi:hypothetical protein
MQIAKATIEFLFGPCREKEERSIIRGSILQDDEPPGREIKVDQSIARMFIC